MWGRTLYYVARDNALITLFSVAVFICISRWGSARPLSRFETAACKCGMAIYLAHPFFRLVFERLPMFSGALQLLMDFPAIMIPLVSFVCYVLSLIVGLLFQWLIRSVRIRLRR